MGRIARRQARQAVIAETVDHLSQEDQESLRVLAQTLAEKLKELKPQAPAGLDFGRLEALEVQLGNITATQGTGARFEEARVKTFKTGDISVGPQPGKR